LIRGADESGAGTAGIEDDRGAKPEGDGLCMAVEVWLT
jgi:hypothetical protein